MNKIKRVIVAIICCVAIVATVPGLSVLTVKAEAQNGTIPDTNITFKEFYGTLIFEGNGAIPDYADDNNLTRPWRYIGFENIKLGAGITEVGKNAFANLKNLKYVTMNSTTFIKDSSSFKGVTNNTTFRILGEEENFKNFGKIRYSSLDSIASNVSDCVLIFDNITIRNKFSEKFYPCYKYLYAADDQSEPWKAKLYPFADVPWISQGSIADGSGLDIYARMRAERQPLKTEFMEVFGMLLQDYTFVCTYNMTLFIPKDGVIRATEKPLKYILKIPGYEQSELKKFKLVEFGPKGELIFLDDLDKAKETITFETSYPSSMYALVYTID